MLVEVIHMTVAILIFSAFVAPALMLAFTLSHTGQLPAPPLPPHLQEWPTSMGPFRSSREIPRQPSCMPFEELRWIC